jgi:hypothetical protein
LEGLGMEKVGIFFVHLEYTKAIWYIVWPLCNLVEIGYLLTLFGILCQENSGNPDLIFFQFYAWNCLRQQILNTRRMLHTFLRYYTSVKICAHFSGPHSKVRLQELCTYVFRVPIGA